MAVQLEGDRWQKIGNAWVQAIVEHDYQQLSQVCQNDVRSRLVIPSEVDRGENVDDLIGSIRSWFEGTSHTQVEYARVEQVGPKVAINYRLRFKEEDEWRTAEQQVYGHLSGGLLAQLDLLCSGFQPVPAPADTKDNDQKPLGQEANPQVEPTLPAADAVLVVKTKSNDQGPTCAVLTPAIKAHLSEIRSGQVLEVRVDDPEAKEDIESWS